MMASSSVEARLRRIEEMMTEVRTAILGPEGNKEHGLIAQTQANTKDIASLKAWRWWTLGGSITGGAGIGTLFKNFPWGGG